MQICVNKISMNGMNVRTNNIVKRFFSDRGSLLKLNIATGFAIKGGSMLLSLVFVPLVLSYLTSYKYGIWLTINSVISWFSMLDVGLSGGLRFKLQSTLPNRDYILSKSYISTAYLSLICISAIAAMLVISFLSVFDFDYAAFFKVKGTMQPELQQVIYITVVCFFVRFTLQPISTILQADQMNFVTSFILLTENLLNFACIYLLSMFTDGNLLYACFIFAITPIINLSLYSFIFFFTKYRDIRPNYKYAKKEYFKPLFGIGVDFFITSISMILLIQSNNIVIAKLFSANDVTNYNIIYKLFSTVSVLFTLVMTPMWSAFANAYNTGAFNWIITTMRKLKNMYMIVFIIYIILIFVAKPIIRIWTGVEISDYKMFICCALYFCIQNYMMIYAYLFNATGDKSLIKLQRNIAIYGALVNIPAIVILVKFFNMGLHSILIGNTIAVLPILFIYPRRAALLFKSTGI